MAQERKYKEALERAKECMKDGGISQNTIDYLCNIFPELKEIKDGNELKWLTQFIQEEAYGLSMDIRDNEDRIKLKNLQKSLAWLEKQAKQNPTDKVEPRFKIGDWVIFNENHNSVYQVERIANNRYYLRHYLEGTLSVHFDINELIRLWTVQDVKDGDVLASGQVVFIFKEIHNGQLYCYCSRHNDGLFIAGSYNLITNKYFSEVHPATEEQRNALFKAMTDIGYTFNFKKKKWENIEQNPT